MAEISSWFADSSFPGTARAIGSGGCSAELSAAFVDRGEFDKGHYRFEYEKREFLGEVRCHVFRISPVPKPRGARFLGRIWVEDQDLTIVRINGRYLPSTHFSFKRFEDEYYLDFDSRRTNVRSGWWLPTYIFSQEIHRPGIFTGPPYRAQTRLWGYKLTPGAREEELSRLHVESSPRINDETQQSTTGCRWKRSANGDSKRETT